MPTESCAIFASFQALLTLHPTKGGLNMGTCNRWALFRLGGARVELLQQRHMSFILMDSDRAGGVQC